MSGAEPSAADDRLTEVAKLLLLDRAPSEGNGYLLDGLTFAPHPERPWAWCVQDADDGALVDILYPGRFVSLVEVEAYLEFLIEDEPEPEREDDRRPPEDHDRRGYE